MAELEDQVGTVTGLAWTEVGGETLTIEVTVVPGTGKLTLTGKLGDVMKESARRFQFTRSKAVELALIGFSREAGCPYPYPGGSHSEGWPFSRHYDCDGSYLIFNQTACSP